MSHPIRPRDTILIVLSIAFQTGAIACGKAASLALHGFTLNAILNDRFYLLSLAFLGMQAVTWQLTLRRFPLALAYSMMSIVYVNVLLLSAFVFHERVSFSNIAGAALIIIGVGLMTGGRRRAAIV